MTVTDSAQTGEPKSHRGEPKAVRLHYLDWLQVLAVLGVFLFHTLLPFESLVGWAIKNKQRSGLATLFSLFFTPWGMAFFFAMAGVTSWFSLRRRTAVRYLRERVLQLLVPFILGVLVLTPILAYYELSYRGWWKGGSIVAFLLSDEVRRYFFSEFHPIVFGPLIFSALGYHLWFLGFLFVFALITVPLFTWLKKDAGKRWVFSLARLTEWRGGLLLLTLPLILSRQVLQPFFPDYTGWSDFSFMLIFFVLGYVLMTDERFMRAIRRDGLLYLVLALACKLLFLSAAVGAPVIEWMVSPGTPGFVLFWAIFGVNAWCWTMVMFNLGMRFLDFSNRVLEYGREASFAFFWGHYPVTYFVAFYVVQWQVSLPIKMGAMIAGSFVLTLGLYELLVRHLNPVRRLFGMRPKRRPQ